MTEKPCRTFEQLTIGELRVSQAIEVTEAMILSYARDYDPQWFHADAEKAKQSRFGGLIASGTQSIALWRKLDHTINSDIDFICGFGWDEVRWPTPLRPGDSIRAKSEVLDLRESSNSLEYGHATYRYSLLNQHDQVVLTMTSKNLVARTTAH